MKTLTLLNAKIRSHVNRHTTLQQATCKLHCSLYISICTGTIKISMWYTYFLFYIARRQAMHSESWCWTTLKQKMHLLEQRQRRNTIQHCCDILLWFWHCLQVSWLTYLKQQNLYLYNVISVYFWSLCARLNWVFSQFLAYCTLRHRISFVYYI